MKGDMLVCAVLLQLVLSILQCGASTQGEGACVLQHEFGRGSFSDRGIIQLPNPRRKEAEIVTQAEILSLSTTKGRAIYRLRVKGQGADNDTTMVMGYTDAGKLKSASLHDEVTIFSDDAGNVIAITVRPQEYSEDEDEEVTSFNTIVRTETPNQAPIPDTAGYLNKMKEEKMKKEKADSEPKSFFAKYWMYLLPLVFLFMISNNSNQQQ